MSDDPATSAAPAEEPNPSAPATEVHAHDHQHRDETVTDTHTPPEGSPAADHEQPTATAAESAPPTREEQPAAPSAEVPREEPTPAEDVTAPVAPQHAGQPEHAAPASAAELAEPQETAAEAPASEATSNEEQPAAPAEKPPEKPRRTRKKAAKAEMSAEETPAAATAAVAAEAAAEPAEQSQKKWYAIKVQSGREESIKAAILRKVAIEGLEQFVGRIEIPVEEEVVKKAVRVKDKKTGEYTTQERKVTKKKIKFHGYLFAELEFNDRILYLFRETSGVGDFLNMRGKPPVPEPMPDHEVRAMLTGEKVVDPKKPTKVKIDFEKGDRVRVREGSFANQEGEVKSISEPKDPTDSPKVKIELTFWGRPLEVDLDHWQVEKV